MINENENIQPELNMVSEESTAPVAEPQSEPVAEPQSESQTDFDSGESTSFTETPAVETQSSSTESQDSVGHYPSSPETSSDVQKTLQQTQQELEQVKQQNAQNQLMYETESYKQQLIQQGYGAEQANATANQYYQQRAQQVQQEKTYKEAVAFKEGQFKASLHYGKKFNVDPEVLLKYQNPQEMETAAKHMSEVRALKEENARLKKGQVPAQSYDNNTAPANASSSEERLLDLYNSGVRNPETEAAARRAAGLG